LVWVVWWWILIDVAVGSGGFFPVSGGAEGVADGAVLDAECGGDVGGGVAGLAQGVPDFVAGGTGSSGNWIVGGGGNVDA
jgi:hypothetical protein